MATPKDNTIEIPQIDKTTLSVCILGTSPYICNRLSEKAKRQILMPPRRKNQAERQSTLKHNPLEEYQASPYRVRDPRAPTLLACPSAAFKSAMCTAALDLPGTKKAQIGRLVYVQGDHTLLYGQPRLSMMPVRSADMNRTPDIRTRAILPRWACKVEVTFVRPILTHQGVINLLVAAGVTVGVGDGRTEKGKLNYGGFVVVEASDTEFQSVLREGRASQTAAMEQPEFYDQDSEDLFTWWTEEVQRRGFERPAPASETDESEDTEGEGEM